MQSNILEAQHPTDWVCLEAGRKGTHVLDGRHPARRQVHYAVAGCRDTELPVRMRQLSEPSRLFQFYLLFLYLSGWYCNVHTGKASGVQFCHKICNVLVKNLLMD